LENIVNDGFYDVGSFGRREVLRSDRPANTEFRFPTLEQLRKRSIDHKREVLLIDFNEDQALQNILKLSKEGFSKYELIEDRIAHVGEVISNHQGGKVDRSRLESFAYSMHIKELKCSNQSNVLHIGSIRKGYFYHRALLFKALADRLGLSCALVRGDYHRAWNIVMIQVGDEVKSFIVDLMHQPGSLIPAESLAAKEYESLKEKKI
jgi:hypothetical protein